MATQRFDNTTTQIVDTDAGVSGGHREEVEIALFNGTTTTKQRGATTLKVFSGSVNAGAAATVWTPSAGKKVRVMGMVLGASANSGATNIRSGTAGSGTTFAVWQSTSGNAFFVDFGNGFLASNANDVIEIVNATAGALTFYVTAWGTEE